MYMPYKSTFYYPESNPYRTGDTIYWNGMKLTVGNDGGELNKWGSEDSHIVTTCGRVLSLDEISRSPQQEKQTN